MARKPVVSRTKVVTKATLLTINLQSQETGTLSVTVPNKFKTEEALLKACIKLNKEPNIKIVAVKDKQEQKLRYIMDELKFIELADEVIEVKDEQESK